MGTRVQIFDSLLDYVIEKYFFIFTFFMTHAKFILRHQQKNISNYQVVVKNISYTAILLIDQFLDVARQIYYLA